ncbi:TlpA family protein disulfide reductase [Spirosoma endophyticum]|uniref:Thiol-disulfide isomerase or thioredoxin n=1 Tax=Spirosoma endophyticum TaxID=662367 RepID=A0A1I2I5M8_9BACT|nr:TlpA disulfide reductase family protein [Spirosoma endophyticum]SFF35801.1 Thiol-disulfide isomerase or thioredoxin [Spirosoma endophyticum]
MKLILTILLLSTSPFLLAQSNLKGGFIKNFTFNGTIDVYKGHVKLIPYSFSAEKEDSIKVVSYQSNIVKGQFKIQGFIPYPYSFALEYFDNNMLKYKSEFFIVELGDQNGTFTIGRSIPSINNKVMGEYYKSESFKKYSRLKRDYHWLSTYSDSLFKAYKRVLPNDAKEELKAIRANYKERNHRLLIDLCLELPNSYISLWKLFDEFRQNGFKDDYDATFFELSTHIKQSKFGGIVKSMIDKSNTIGQGKKMPSYTYKNVKFSTIDSLKLDHKYTLIQFWNTSCGTCIASIPKMQELYNKHSDKGFNIVSICYDEKDRMTVLNRILSRYQPSWNEYFDENGVNSKSLGITYPRYIILDNSGVIIDNRSSIETAKKLLETKVE